MEILFVIIGIICLVLGLAGCIVPMLPGPPISYVALILLHFTSQAEFSVRQLTIWLVLVAIVQMLDYLVPMWGSKYIGGSKWGSRGCLLGTIVGLFFMPYGIILGPFLGAVIGELLGGNDTNFALKSGFGSLLGFLFGTLLKCMLCGYFAWEFFSAWLG